MTSSLCVITFIFLVKSVMTSQVINIANDDVMLAIHTRAVQASQASSICRENASRLVSIEDAKIQQLITAHIGEIPIDETHFNDRRLFVGFWTAGRQEAQDDGWMWWTGDQQPGLDPDHRRPTAILEDEDEDEEWSNYTNWVGYSPVITMYPSCIYVYPHYQVVYETSSVNVTFNDTIGGWLNKPCRMRSYFICEKKINKQTVTSSNTAYYVIIPVIFVILSIVIVTGFCFLYRRRTRLLKMKSARSSNHMTEELRNGYRDDDDDDVNNGGGDDVTNGLTRDTQFNDSWKNDDAVMTSSRRGRQISQLNNETYESNIHFTPVKKNDDSDYDEPPDEREYFERNKLFSNFDENDYDVPPDETFGTHSEFSSDESYHLSDIEAFDTHSQDQVISSPTHPPPPEPEQIYASIESLNKIERSSSAPRRGVHHQQSLHKITNFSHIPHRDVSHRKKFPLPHEAQHSNHRSFASHRNTTQSMRSHDTIPENRV